MFSRAEKGKRTQDALIDAAYRQKYAGNPYLSRLRHHYRDAPDLPDIGPDAEAPETPTPEAR